MQATIRLDGGQDRDRGLIVVRDAPAVSGPIFFTLQRFPDGKYLSADSLWRTDRDTFRSDDYRQKAGTLVIPVGPDILYELDSDASYRMSINDSASFALTVERKLFTALQGKAALEEYQRLHAGSQDHNDALAPPLSRRPKSHGLHWPALLVPLLALVLCLGLALKNLARDQYFPLQDTAISLTSTPMSDQDEAVYKTRPVSETTRENVARIIAQGSSLSHGASSSMGAELLAQGSAENTFTRTVSEYLHSNHVSADLNVQLARKVRVEGAGPRETDTAFELLQDAANDGNTEAMFMLAQYYDPLSSLPHGSVEPDPCLARDWYRRAQQGGLAKAALACEELRNYIARKATAGDRKAQEVLRYW